VTKSTEKIGPKIVSKYSMSKYHSNFDDMNIEDELEDELMEVKEMEDTLKLSGEAISRVL